MDLFNAPGEGKIEGSYPNPRHVLADIFWKALFFSIIDDDLGIVSFVPAVP